ncbi:MAG TPA: beta-galactosidase [Armatimonadota bacterium]|nr:beta-galactosidase [Armatimonadota bacterium]
MRVCMVFSCCLLAITLSTAMATVVDDFAQPSSWFISKGQERGATFTYAPAPGNTNQCGKVSWQAQHAPYFELHLNQPQLLHDFATDGNGTLSMKVYSEKNAAVGTVNLRLLDARGEIFQIVKTVSFTTAGWQELTYRIETNAPYESWGTVNKQFDYPLRLLGFAIGIDPHVQQAGELYLDDIRTTGMGRTVPAFRTVWDFAHDGPWQKTVSDDVVKFTPCAEGLDLHVLPSEKDIAFTYNNRALTLIPQGKPPSIAVQADLLAGSSVAVALRLCDAQGEVFTYPAKYLDGGSNTLTWDVAGEKLNSWKQSQQAVTNWIIDYPIAIQELFISHAASPYPATMRLRSLVIRERVAAMDAVTVDVETGTPIHVLKVGDEAKLALRIRNTALIPQELTADVQLENIDGERIPLQKSFSLAAQEAVTWQMPTLPKFGIWWIKYTLRDNNGDGITTGQRSCCYLQPAGPTPGRATGFLFGVNSHTARWAGRDQELEILAAALCGAKTMRVDIGQWGHIEPQDNQWNWSVVDSMVDRYAKQGIELDLMMSPYDAAKWAWVDEQNHVCKLESWDDFVAIIAKRYNNRIRFWEIGNEPDLMRNVTDTLYLSWMERAYREIKQVNPQMQVLTGGFALASYVSHPGQTKDFFPHVVQQGQANYDILAMHLHGSFPNFQREVDGYLAQIRNSLRPSKPLWFNETAVTSANSTERMQSETLVKKLMFAWARGAMGYQWYDLRNDGYDPKYGEHNFGMVTNDFYPKAAYPAFNTLALHFRDKHFVKQLAMAQGQWGLVFADNREQSIALWNDDANAADTQLLLHTDARQAFRMDLMGNTTPLPMSKGCIVLTFSPMPSYVTLVGAKTPPTLAAAPLITVKAARPTFPGDQQVLRVQFTNPLSVTTAVDVTWETPVGLQTKNAMTHLVLKPNTTADATAQVAVPGDAVARYGDVRHMNLTYKFTGVPWAGTLDIPIVMAAYIPQGGGRPHPGLYPGRSLAYRQPV